MQKFETPSALIFPLNIYLAPSWANMFDVDGDSGVDKAKEVLNVVRQMFILPSLDTKFVLEYKDSDFFVTIAELKAKRSDLADLNNYISAPTGGPSSIVYLTAAPSEYRAIANIIAICEPGQKKAKSITKWDGSVTQTAEVLAHEIGHTLGFYHDFEQYPQVRTGRKHTCGPGK